MMSRISGSRMKPAFTISANPARISLRRQGVEQCRGRRAPRRRVERADEVLALVRVDAGLAADGRVDHAEHGRRHLHDADAAQPGGGDEAGEVGDRSPAEADDGVGAGEVGLAEHLPAERGDLDALAGLGVGNLGEQHLVAVAAATRAARRPWPRASAGCTMSTFAARGAERVGEFAEHAAADDDVVAASRRPRGCSCASGLRSSCSSESLGDVVDDACDRAARRVDVEVGDGLVERPARVEDGAPALEPAVGDQRPVAAREPRPRPLRRETVQPARRRGRRGRRGCRGPAPLPRRARRRRPRAAPRPRPRARDAEVLLALRVEDLGDRAVRSAMRMSVSMNGASTDVASRCPTRDLPAPIGPMSTIGSASRTPSDTVGGGLCRGDGRAQRVGDRGEVARRGCDGSRRPSRRRTSRARRSRARARPSPRRRRRRRAPRRRRNAGGAPRRPRRWRRRPCGSACGTVAIGFMPARTRSTVPVLMPPSVPPARSLDARDAAVDPMQLVVRLASRDGWS